ncbi:hypothetical protein ACE1SV_22720 [Streptomyces sp. E-15]
MCGAVVCGAVESGAVVCGVDGFGRGMGMGTGRGVQEWGSPVWVAELSTGGRVRTALGGLGPAEAV